MKDTWQVVLSGIGGQGLMLAGKLLGDAAVSYEGKYAVMTSAFGVEMRGAFAKSDVIVSSEEIDYPEVLDADIVVALAPVAYQRYAGLLGPSAILLYDDAIVALPCPARQLGFPITKLAKEAGSPSAANIVALGLLVKATGIVGGQALESAVREEYRGKEKLAELNIGALRLGFKAAEGIDLSIKGGKQV